MAVRGADGATEGWTEQRWADRFRLEAAIEQGLDLDDVERALANVGVAVADAGVPADELFGTPEEHARQIAADQPVEVRAAAQADDQGGGPLVHALVSMGLLALVGALYTVLQGTWSVALSASTLIGGALLALTFAAGAGVLWLRRAGLPATSWAAVAATVALTVATATVLTGEAGQQVFGRLPVAVLALVGLGLIAVVFVLPDRRPRRRERGRSRSAAAWYRRLGGLLRGRHRFPLARTRDLVDEARSHVAASGATHPSDDLGEPAHHALVLAEASTHPSIAVTRTQRVARVAVPVALTGLAVVLVGQYLEGGSWTLLIGPCLLALVGLSALLTSRRRR